MNLTQVPERIGRLGELANNLWWSWHPQARNVFRTLDYQLWKLSGHNPVKELRHNSRINDMTLQLNLLRLDHNTEIYSDAS